ncbi:MAG: amidohydrolase [Gemmatimonadota bacterium]|jgi:aminobenzoyl-glutamate utilization protein B
MRPPIAVALLLASLFHVVPPAPAGAQEPNEAMRAALDHATELEGEVERMAMRLWDYSEIALREVRSADLLAGVLQEEGFTVERGVAGMPTAFVATWGEGAPVVGILAEYDALPGIGNAVEPRRSPREDGYAHGQGCGHNLFGAASVGAALALKRAMEDEGVSGTVKLFGTPAEETVVGKVYMARDGVFDGLDAVLEWHPGQETQVNNNAGLAMNNFEIEYHGQAAHGAADPWNGRSALDAVELLDYGVNLMREHIRPSARIHYVIPSAGEAPNVVPEYAKAWYYVRDTVRSEVEKEYAWVLDIAAAAAQATRTTHEVTLVTGVHSYNLNRPLQEALQRNLERVGPAGFTEEDQAFAKDLQAFLEVDQKGLVGEIEPLEDGPETPSGGSTDVAEVSWLAPTAGISVTTAAAGVPWHSWATAASHGTTGAVRGAWVAAKVLAMTGAELMTREELLAAARETFEASTEGRPYVSPLPAGQTPPVPDDIAGGSGEGGGRN